MHPLVVVAALMPGGFAQFTPPVGEPLSGLVPGLEQSGKSAADKFDALHFALHGRFATAREHLVLKHRYGYKLTPDAHIELRWAAGFVSPFDHRRDWFPFNGPPYGIPKGRLSHAYGHPLLGWGSVLNPPVQLFGTGDTGFLPNPLALPPVPWYPPGSPVPMPRVGR